MGACVSPQWGPEGLRWGWGDRGVTLTHVTTGSSFLFCFLSQWIPEPLVWRRASS